MIKNRLISRMNEFLEAKKKEALFLRLFFAAIVVIIGMILFFAYRTSVNAMNRILVVSTGGQFLPVQANDQDELYRSLVTSHCYSAAYYANSFDVTNITTNQSRASFLINRQDLNLIIQKYTHDKAYSLAVNSGYVYRCDFDRILRLTKSGNQGEYDVAFRSVLHITSSTEDRSVEIISTGHLIRVTPRFPENPSGFYFRNYNQEYNVLTTDKPIENGNE